MRIQFIVGLIASLALALGLKWWESNQLQTQLDVAALQNSSLAEKYKTTQASLNALQTMQSAQAQQRQQLQQQLSALETENAQRQQQLWSLQYENQQLRDWATQPLPDVLVRLYHRPGIRTGAGYLEYLRNTRALPANAGQPDK